LKINKENSKIFSSQPHKVDILLAANPNDIIGDDGCRVTFLAHFVFDSTVHDPTLNKNAMTCNKNVIFSPWEYNLSKKFKLATKEA
jgi:hypothetical protein